jgi:hypothetical protein
MLQETLQIRPRPSSPIRHKHLLQTPPGNFSQPKMTVISYSPHPFPLPFFFFLFLLIIFLHPLLSAGSDIDYLAGMDEFVQPLADAPTHEPASKRLRAV